MSVSQGMDATMAATLGYDDEGPVDYAALFDEPTAPRIPSTAPLSLTFPLYPAPVHFERADVHARLILSTAEAALLRLVVAVSANSNAVNGPALADDIRGRLQDLASDISGAFGLAAEDVGEREDG